MDRLANPFAPAAGESDPGSPPFVFFLPAMAKATAPDDAFAVRHERPAHCPSTSQRVQILVFLLGMALGWLRPLAGWHGRAVQKPAATPEPAGCAHGSFHAVRAFLTGHRKPDASDFGPLQIMVKLLVCRSAIEPSCRMKRRWQQVY
jgi:hypothetical protein